MKVTGIDAVYYTVSDVNKLKQFYTDLLGAPPDTEWPDRLAEWTFADGNSFGLYGVEGNVETRSGSAMFAVDDVVKATAEAKARGVKFQDHDTETPVCFMAFGEDPEGNNFILHHRK